MLEEVKGDLRLNNIFEALVINRSNCSVIHVVNLSLPEILCSLK